MHNSTSLATEQHSIVLKKGLVSTLLDLARWAADPDLSKSLSARAGYKTKTERTLRVAGAKNKVEERRALKGEDSLLRTEM
jgi:hypothetical protein